MQRLPVGFWLLAEQFCFDQEPRADFAQVGEWLKPTDCKSVPPSEVRRFESFPVHHDLRRFAGVSLNLRLPKGRWEPAAEILSVVREGSEVMNRLSIALVCYVVLGALTWA